MIEKSEKSPLLRAALDDKCRIENKLAVVFGMSIPRKKKDGSTIYAKTPNFKGWPDGALDNQSEADIKRIYSKNGSKNQYYSYFAGIGGLLGIDFDWRWPYYLAQRHFKERFNTRTIQTPNGGYRVLFLTNNPESNEKYKSIPPHVEIHGTPGSRHMVVYGKAHDENGKLMEYKLVKDLPIRYDPNIIEDMMKFLDDIAEKADFLQWNCIKKATDLKTVNLGHLQRVHLGNLLLRKFSLEDSAYFFSLCPDFDYQYTKDRQLGKSIQPKVKDAMEKEARGEELGKGDLKPPSCKTLIRDFKHEESDCQGCPRKNTNEPIEETSTITVETKDYTITNLDCCLEIIKEGNPLETITKIISKDVKHEDPLIKLILLVMTSAYTPNPLNLALEGPQSEGKSYPLTKVAKIFPSNDVWKLGGMSPASLRREKGILMDRKTGKSLEPQIMNIKKRMGLLGESKADKAKKGKLKAELVKTIEKGVNTINLEGKILLFLEAPHKNTFEELRPILSRDVYEIIYKYVDRAYQNGPQVTIEARIRGWPVAIYATADAPKGHIWKQIRSRFIVVSPNMNKAKYKSANILTADTYGGWSIPHKLGEEDQEIKKAARYIQLVKQALYSVFITTHKKATPHQTKSNSPKTQWPKKSRSLPTQ